jgi:hypothetical protein
MPTREDEAWYVLAGELEVGVGEEIYILRAGDTPIGPRNLPHRLRNASNAGNHYRIMFSPSGFEGFVKATAVPAPDNRLLQLSHPALPFGASWNSPPTMEYISDD